VKDHKEINDSADKSIEKELLIRFETFTAYECFKPSRAISRVNVDLKTDVSETTSVSIIGDTDADDGDKASLRNVGFYSKLTRLIAREDFITEMLLLSDGPQYPRRWTSRYLLHTIKQLLQ
jgi:hypothetical protein